MSKVEPEGLENELQHLVKRMLLLLVCLEVNLISFALPIILLLIPKEDEHFEELLEVEREEGNEELFHAGEEGVDCAEEYNRSVLVDIRLERMLHLLDNQRPELLLVHFDYELQVAIGDSLLNLADGGHVAAGLAVEGKSETEGALEEFEEPLVVIPNEFFLDSLDHRLEQTAEVPGYRGA